MKRTLICVLTLAFALSAWHISFASDFTQPLVTVSSDNATNHVFTIDLSEDSSGNFDGIICTEHDGDGNVVSGNHPFRDLNSLKNGVILFRPTLSILGMTIGMTAVEIYGPDLTEKGGPVSVKILRDLHGFSMTPDYRRLDLNLVYLKNQRRWTLETTDGIEFKSLKMDKAGSVKGIANIVTHSEDDENDSTISTEDLSQW